jgi:hypothetical protein
MPADYRIQKMRAAEESSRQMNAYVKVRTPAMSPLPSRFVLGPAIPFPAAPNADSRVPSPLTTRTRLHNPNRRVMSVT